MCTMANETIGGLLGENWDCGITCPTTSSWPSRRCSTSWTTCAWGWRVANTRTRSFKRVSHPRRDEDLVPRVFVEAAQGAGVPVLWREALTVYHRTCRVAELVDAVLGGHLQQHSATLRSTANAVESTHDRCNIRGNGLGVYKWPLADTAMALRMGMTHSLLWRTLYASLLNITTGLYAMTSRWRAKWRERVSTATLMGPKNPRQLSRILKATPGW